MRLSVVVLTQNNESTLPLLLRQLSLQDVTEVILADMGSHDSTIAIARRFGADVARSTTSNMADLLNAAARLASYDVLLFLPGDASISSDVGNRVLDYLETHSEAVGTLFRMRATGSILAGVRQLLSGNQSPGHLPAFAVLRHVFLKVGGFSDGEGAVEAFVGKLASHGTMPLIRQNIKVGAH